MAIELINIGNIANDGTGDELRVAFRKINQNFEEVDIRLGDAVEGENTGGGAGVFKERIDNDLYFRSLIAGQNVTVTENEASIEISASTDTPVITDSGSYILTTGGNLRVLGGDGIETELDVSDNSIVINNTKNSELSQDTSPELSATLDANFNDIEDVNVISANEFRGGSFYGTLFGSIANASTSDINNFFGNLDFGDINPTVTNLYDIVALHVDVDYGSIIDPAPYISDFGSLV